MKKMIKLLLTAGIAFALPGYSHAQQKSSCDFLVAPRLTDSLRAIVQGGTFTPQFKPATNCYNQPQMQLLDIPQPVVKYSSGYCDYYSGNDLLALLFSEEDLQKLGLTPYKPAPLGNNNNMTPKL